MAAVAGGTGGAGSAEPTGAGWFAELAASLAKVEVFGLAMVVADATTGRIHGSTSTATELLGTPWPARVADLVETGVVARPDVDRLQRHVDGWRARDDAARAGAGGESSHSWSDEVRIHRADGPRLVHLEVVHHRRPSIGAEAVVVTLRAVGVDGPGAPDDGGERRTDLWAIYDDQLRMVAADPGFADLGIDPLSQIGTLATVYSHPEDLPLVLPLVHDVLAGRARRATYSLRVAAQNGRWLPGDVEAHRLVTPDGPLVVLVLRYVDTARRLVAPGTLTPRERDLVAGLFEGLRVNQLAERHGLAVKTVRHHLASVYKKLDVTGQVDLLATYHQPAAAT